MPVTTSDKAVTAYLDNLLNDICLDAMNEDIQAPSLSEAPSPEYRATDTVDVTRRVAPLVDPFMLMDMRANHTHYKSKHTVWLSIHSLLPLMSHLPDSNVKQYCLSQCQILLQKVQSQP